MTSWITQSKCLVFVLICILTYKYDDITPLCNIFAFQHPLSSRTWSEDLTPGCTARSKHLAVPCTVLTSVPGADISIRVAHSPVLCCLPDPTPLPTPAHSYVLVAFAFVCLSPGIISKFSFCQLYLQSNPGRAWLTE